MTADSAQPRNCSNAKVPRLRNNHPHTTCFCFFFFVVVLGAQVILQYYLSYRFPLHRKIWSYCPEWPRRAARISRVKCMEKQLLNQQKLRARDRVLPPLRGKGSGDYLVSFPDPAPLRGKEGLGTLVDFLGILCVSNHVTHAYSYYYYYYYYYTHQNRCRKMDER